MNIKKLEGRTLLVAAIATCAICTGAVLADEVKKTESSGSPKDACKALVEAAKTDDFKSAMHYTLRSDSLPSSQMAGEAAVEGEATKPAATKGSHKFERSGFHKMHKQHMERIKELSCGSEHIAGTHAIVEAESKGEKRLIPFVQVAGSWKFDAKTYMSFYRDSMKRKG